MKFKIKYRSSPIFRNTTNLQNIENAQANKNVESNNPNNEFGSEVSVTKTKILNN